jgi:N-acetylneuraminic acid mutarotase
VCHIAFTYNNELYIQGGHNPDPQKKNKIVNVVGDLLKYNFQGETWSLIDPKFSPRTEHSYVIYKDQLWLIGGYCLLQRYSINMMIYDFKTDLREHIHFSKKDYQSNVPVGRSAHTTVIYNDEIYMFGGWNGRDTNNDFYVYNITTGRWSKVEYSGDMPEQRRSHSAAIVDHKMYIFGGFDGDNNSLPYMHEFDCISKVWRSIKGKGDIPCSRSRCKMIYFNRKLVIMGGWDRVNHFRDWYEFDLKSEYWKKMNIDLPFEQGFASHAAVSMKEGVFVYGGYDCKTENASNMLWGYLFDYPCYNDNIYNIKNENIDENIPILQN